MGSVCHPSLEQMRGRELLEEELRLHERVSAHDQAALLEWLRGIGGMVHSAALSHSPTAAAAEEMTAMLFLEVWQDPTMFHPSRGPLVLQLIRRMRTSFGSRQRPGTRTSTEAPQTAPATLPPRFILPAGS